MSPRRPATSTPLPGPRPRPRPLTENCLLSVAARRPPLVASGDEGCGRAGPRPVTAFSSVSTVTARRATAAASTATATPSASPFLALPYPYAPHPLPHPDLLLSLPTGSPWYPYLSHVGRGPPPGPPTMARYGPVLDQEDATRATSRSRAQRASKAPRTPRKPRPAELAAKARRLQRLQDLARQQDASARTRAVPTARQPEPTKIGRAHV